MSAPPPTPGERILTLDVLRGVAVLGILMVNAVSFAMPAAVGDLPNLSPFAFEGASVAIWWVTHVFFEQKFVTLFSLLFGASVFLVGGERSEDPARGRVLLRRLLWLLAFGALHGAFIWFGDILLLYGLAGLVMMLCRSWGPARLTLFAFPLMGWSVLRLLEVEFTFQNLSPEVRRLYTPGVEEIGGTIVRFGGDLGAVQGVNLELWWRAVDYSVQFYAPLTLGLMMAGLALFKSGVLTGRASASTYRRLVVVGAIALATIGWNGADQIRDGFPAETRAFDYLVNLTLAPLVTLGYVGLICLMLRQGRLQVMARALAAVGRMAFTNYVSQSLIMSAIFFGGRGLGLYGRLDWPQWTAIVLVVWALQVGWSGWWLARFRLGPLEWLWRALSYGRVIPLRRSSADRSQPPRSAAAS